MTNGIEDFEVLCDPAALCDQTFLVRKGQVGGVLLGGGNPPISDEEAFDIPRSGQVPPGILVALLDGPGDIWDMLTGIRLARQVYLSRSQRSVVMEGRRREGQDGIHRHVHTPETAQRTWSGR